MDNSADNRRIFAITLDPHTQQVFEVYREGDRWTKRESSAPVLMPSDEPTVHITRPFTKSWNEMWPVLAQNPPTQATIKVLSVLVPNVHYQHCVCSHKNNKPITMEWIAQATGLHRNSVSKSMKWLEDNGYILRRDGRILLNPYFHQKGRQVSKRVLDLFADTPFAKGATEDV